MRREDVPVVVAIDRLCSPLPWTDYAFVGELTNTIGCYLVAEVTEPGEAKGTILGFVGSQMIMDEAHITTFGVLPEWRRQRIGERLFASLLERAIARGCRRVTLEVREGNLPAQALYRKYGFMPISRRRGYYSDNREDAIVMWIEDTTRLGFRNLFGERLAALGP
jgi:ribosomal-protein-alanine N-acetyltransferase